MNISLPIFHLLFDHEMSNDVHCVHHDLFHLNQLIHLSTLHSNTNQSIHSLLSEDKSLFEEEDLTRN